MFCTCTRPHDEEICASCSYSCDNGQILCWPMPDLDRYEIIFHNDGVTIRKKRKGRG